MDDFELELKRGFLDEALQLLTDTEQCFLSLESNPGDLPILEKIFRLAHNLKGSSKAVGFCDLGLFTHEFESFLLKLKKGELAVTSCVVTLLLKCNDHIRSTIEALRENLDAKVDHSQIQLEVECAMRGEFAEATTNQPAEMHLEKVETSKVQGLTLGEETVCEEPENNIPIPKEKAEHGRNPEVKSQPPVSGPVAEESIRVSLHRLERLINFVGEMVILQAVLREQSFSSDLTLLRKSVHQLGSVGKEIQDISMSLRMVPVKQTFQKMQRIVRDTSNLLGKKVNLLVSGEETELDKTVLESLSDPLVHLIRNAVDHGIEASPQARVEAGKPEQGSVFLNAYHQGGKLVIEVRDDGGGIPHERLIAKAKEKGILRADQNLTKEQGVNLVFHPGFSTKAEVTEVSGRGVGMDVVKTNIEALKGDIQIHTELGKGTSFLIRLPLTLAIIDGMVISLAQQRFVIPLSHVHESYSPEPEDVKAISGLGEVLLLRGENLPLFRLSTLLGLKREERPATEGIALVCRVSGSPFAILVDDILGQQQVVIKKLGNEMQTMVGFSGSAILGDGKPALILEFADLIQKNKKSPLRSGEKYSREIAV